MGEDVLPSPRRLVLKLVVNSTNFPVCPLTRDYLQSFKEIAFFLRLPQFVVSVQS